jgi:hypothetical protein
MRGLVPVLLCLGASFHFVKSDAWLARGAAALVGDDPRAVFATVFLGLLVFLVGGQELLLRRLRGR